MLGLLLALLPFSLPRMAVAFVVTFAGVSVTACALYQHLILAGLFW